MWFTIAVEEDSDARPAGHARRAPGAHRRRVDPPAADAEAVQDPHGPRARGRHRRAGQGGRGRRSPSSSRSSPTTSSTCAVIRATQGDLPIVAEPYAPAAAAAGHERRRAARAPAGDGRARHPAPRRRDPLPPPRRLQRQRHGRVEGPRRAHRRAGAADGRLPRHLALLPAPDLRRLALLDLHHGPRALQGGVRRDPRRDRRRERPRSRTARRSTARPSSRRSAFSTSPTTSRPGNASTRASDGRFAHRRALDRALRPRAAAGCPAGSTRRSGR